MDESFKVSSRSQASVQYGGLLGCQLSVDGPRGKGFVLSLTALEDVSININGRNFGDLKVNITTKCRAQLQGIINV